MKMKTLKTIDEYCNQPKGSFRKFSSKRLQNYKKCIGCNASYDLDVALSECTICGCKKFIHDTTYL